MDLELENSCPSSFNQLKLNRLEYMVRVWEEKLRAKRKYSETQDTTWESVSEMYYEIRNEYLVVDLLDENL